MGFSETYNKAAKAIVPRWLRNRFMGAVLYSQTLNPYVKFGAGIACFTFMPNIPGPVDFFFYLSLVVDGARGSYKHMKGYVNGAHKRARDEICLAALSQLYDVRPERQYIVGYRQGSKKRPFTQGTVYIEYPHDKTLAFLPSPHGHTNHP